MSVLELLAWIPGRELLARQQELPWFGGLALSPSKGKGGDLVPER